LDSSTPTPTTPDDADLDEERPRALVIEVAGRAYALPVATVRGVIRASRLTPIPGAPPAALGLVNVRGLVVTVLSLAELLRDEAGASRDANGPVARAIPPVSVVLLEYRGRAVGVAVDAVLGVRPLDAGDETPEQGGDAANDAAVAEHATPATVLDPEALLAHVMLSAEDGR
jgi:purine-binding chemotaxis protein CheW